MPPNATAAFQTPDAGSDYFATEAHYISLSARIVATLRRGSHVVFVTGDPPPSSVVLSQMLRAAAIWWYRVIDIACGPEIGRDELMSVYAAAAANTPGGMADAAEKFAPGLPPLFVFDDGDRLSDRQIEEICEALGCSDGDGAVGVLLARPTLLDRLESPRPRWLGDSPTARVRVAELGREEIPTFIRRQLRSEGREDALDADTITTIGDVAGGDPALVNHLSRLSLSFTAAAEDEIHRRSVAASQPTGRAGGSGIVTTQPNLGASPGTPDRKQDAAAILESSAAASVRRRSAWRWPIGITACLVVGALLLLPKYDIGALTRRAGITSLVDKAQQLSAPTLAGAVHEIMRPFGAIAGGHGSEPVAASHKPTATLAATWRRQQPLRTDCVVTMGEAHAALAQASAKTVVAASATLAAGSTSQASDLQIVAPGDAVGASYRAAVATVPPTASKRGDPAAASSQSADGPSVGSAPAAAQPAIATRAAGASAEPSVKSAAAIVTPTSVPASRPEPLVTPQRLSPAEVAALVTRGDAFVGLRDLASARLLYARAAAAGDGRAALRMGATYDPAFLDRVGIIGVLADQQQAISWYRRARALGEAEAMHRLDEHNPTQ